MTSRKEDHIDLSFKSQLSEAVNYGLFYEPALNSFDVDITREVLGKKISAPFWISSMTGGNVRGEQLNKSFSTCANDNNICFALGSCRSLLNSDQRLQEFLMRQYNKEGVIFANLGIAQVYECLVNNELYKIETMIKKIKADGLILHINPLQEYFQPEGDVINFSIIETVKNFLDQVSYPVIIKEVGQGMGPKSLKAILELPIYGIELAAFGGTNFSKLEAMRSDSIATTNPLVAVGHSPEQMVEWIKESNMNTSVKVIIVSGGIQNVLHGYSLIQKLNLPHIQTFIGQASNYLKAALIGQENIDNLVKEQISQYKTAKKYMRFYE